MWKRRGGTHLERSTKPGRECEGKPQQKKKTPVQVGKRLCHRTSKHNRKRGRTNAGLTKWKNAVLPNQGSSAGITASATPLRKHTGNIPISTGEKKSEGETLSMPTYPRGEPLKEFLENKKKNRISITTKGSHQGTADWRTCQWKEKTYNESQHSKKPLRAWKGGKHGLH